MISLKHAFLWSFSSSAIPLIIAPVVLLVLARLLTPDDFGVVAMVMVIMAFLKLFRNAGLGQLIIQSETKDISNFVFSIQLVISFILVGLIFVLAPLIGDYFSTPEVANVLRVAALELIISPFLDVPVFLSMREIDFKTQFIRTSLAPSIGGLVSILLAYHGFAYWSIIYGSLIGALSAALVISIWLKWFPRLDFNYSKYKRHTMFGVHMLGQGLLAWVINELDKFFLGRYQDKEQVGLYEVASRASLLPFSLLSAPTNRLMYPVFAKTIRENNEITDLYFKVTKYVALISVPVSVFLIINAEDLILYLLGERWRDSSFAFRYIVVGALIATIVTLNVEVYKAIGRPDIMTRFMLFRGLVSLPVYYFAAQFGIVFLAMSRAVLALILGPINTYILLKTIRVSKRKFFALLLKPVTIGAALIVVDMVLKASLGEGFQTLLLNTIALVFVMTYVLKAKLLMWFR